MQINNENLISREQSTFEAPFEHLLPSQWDNGHTPPQANDEEKSNKRQLQESEFSELEDADNLEVLGEDELNAELEDALAEIRTVTLRPDLTIPENFTPLLQQALKNLYHFLKQLSPTNHLGLRPHQRRPLIEFCNGLMDGKCKALFDYPTGTGKTILFKTLINVMFANISPKPEILVVSSRIEVCKQIKDVLGYAFPVDVVTYAKLKLNLAKNPVAANRFGKKVSYYEAFDMIVFDEAHNSLAEQGVKLGQQVDAAIQKTGGIWCSFSATPSYNIRKAKGFQDVSQLMTLTAATNPITPYSLVEAIKDGALAPVRTAVLTPNLDEATVAALSAREINANSEINERKVQRIIDRPEFNQLLVNMYANGQAPNGMRFLGKQGIAFCQGTLHADHVAEQINNSLAIDSHPVLRQLRENYVNNMRAKAIANGQPFSEELVRREFKIAQSIHSEPRIVTLTSSKMPEALKQGGFHPAGDKFYKFKDEEKESLKKAIENGEKEWEFYLPALTLEQRDAIRKGFLEGRYLLLTGADILTEGCDFPKACFIFNFRATKSQVLKIQTCGRGDRLDMSDPNKIAYIIDVNWGIRGQLFFYEFLGGKMSLGKMPEVSLPATPIPTFNLPPGVGIKDVKWEPNGVHVINQASKKRRKDSNATAKTTLTEEEFERSLQRTEDKLLSFSNMVKRYNSALSETDTVRVNSTSVSIVTTQGAREQDTPARPRAIARSGGGANAQPIADRSMAFTRGAKEKMVALTEQMKAGIEELQSFIGSLKAITQEERPNKKARSANSAIGQDLEQQHHTSVRSEPVDKVILKLQATSNEFSRLLSQVTHQMNQGVNACSTSSSSGGTLREIAPSEIETQVQQLEAQVKTIEESNELQKLMEHVKQVRTRKKGEQQRREEEQKKAEQQRVAEQQRKAEEKRIIDEQRQAQQHVIEAEIRKVEQQLQEEQRKSDQQKLENQSVQPRLNLQPVEVVATVQSQSSLANSLAIANDQKEVVSGTNRLDSDELRIMLSAGFTLEELLNCTSPTILYILNNLLAKNEVLSACEINFLLQCASHRNLEVWKEYIIVYWKDIKILINNKVLQPDHLACLHPDINLYTHYNLENLLTSPSKFSPNSLGDLLGVGYKFEDLYCSKSTWTVHWLLHHALTIKKCVHSATNYKLDLGGLFRIHDSTLNEVLTTIEKVLACKQYDSRFGNYVIAQIFNGGFGYYLDIGQFLIRIFEGTAHHLQLNNPFRENLGAWIVAGYQDYSVALLAYVIAMLEQKEDVSIFTAMITVAGSHRDIAMARVAFTRACQLAGNSDSPYGAMLGVALDLKDFKLAHEVYDKAYAAGQASDWVTRLMMSMMGPMRCAVAQSVFQKLRTKSAATYELMIQLACDANDLDSAQRVLDEARQSVAASLSPHLAMIMGASKKNQANLAFETYTKIPPELVTLQNRITILDSLVKERYFNTLTDHLFLTKDLTWNCKLQTTITLPRDKCYGTTYLALKSIQMPSEKSNDLVTIKYTTQRQVEAVRDLCQDYPDRFCILDESDKHLILEIAPAAKPTMTVNGQNKPQTDFFKQSSNRKDNPESGPREHNNDQIPRATL